MEDEHIAIWEKHRRLNGRLLIVPSLHSTIAAGTPNGPFPSRRNRWKVRVSTGSGPVPCVVLQNTFFCLTCYTHDERNDNDGACLRTGADIGVPTRRALRVEF